jgi:hypothetical protein
MIKSIIVMLLLILSTIQETWIALPPACPTPRMDRTLTLSMTAVNDVGGHLIGFRLCMWIFWQAKPCPLFTNHSGYLLMGNGTKLPIAPAQCNSVRKPFANLPDTLIALSTASKHSQMLPGPLELCNVFSDSAMAFSHSL